MGGSRRWSLPSTSWRCRNTADTFHQRRRVKDLTEHGRERGLCAGEIWGKLPGMRFEPSPGFLLCTQGWEGERESFLHPSPSHRILLPMLLWVQQNLLLEGKLVTPNTVNSADNWKYKCWQCCYRITQMTGLWLVVPRSSVFSFVEYLGSCIESL